MTGKEGTRIDPAFVDLIRQALRAYRRGDVLASLTQFNDLQMVQDQLRRRPALGWAGAARAVLDAGLDRLVQAQPEAAHILRDRFVKGRSALQVALACNYSERTLYDRQHEAQEALAEILWQGEAAARRRAQLGESQQRVLDGLPPPTYSRLFGVGDKLERLKGFLRDERARWLVAVDGMGGIGKTALSRAAVEELVIEGRFEAVAWITAQQRFFAWGRAHEVGGPALTYGALLEELAQALQLGSLAALVEEERERRLRAALRRRPTLIVVDNLETAADVQALVMGLDRLARPAKALLTTRHRISACEQVTSLTLAELGRDDALAFIRCHAAERNVPVVLAASEANLERIAQVTGGNPLAIKLVLGQMLSLPLDKVLADLAAARGTGTDFYRFIFYYSWQRLSQPARELLLHMPLLDPRGATWQDLSAVSGVSLNGNFDPALLELVNASLFNVGCAQGEMWYSIHRLTEYFILSDLVRE
ncbi:MAG: hypothetical protein JXA37_02955 [Chloroflexia bacterium]|nr:hypothetical protein [Chloroflexia bacterium]